MLEMNRIGQFYLVPFIQMNANSITVMKGLQMPSVLFGASKSAVLSIKASICSLFMRRLTLIIWSVNQSGNSLTLAPSGHRIISDVSISDTLIMIKSIYPFFKGQ